MSELWRISKLALFQPGDDKMDVSAGFQGSIFAYLMHKLITLIPYQWARLPHEDIVLHDRAVNIRRAPRIENRLRSQLRLKSWTEKHPRRILSIKAIESLLLQASRPRIMSRIICLYHITCHTYKHWILLLA